jgi:hypothetical protein
MTETEIRSYGKKFDTVDNISRIGLDTSVSIATFKMFAEIAAQLARLNSDMKNFIKEAIDAPM